jgi:hypothetical protein
MDDPRCNGRCGNSDPSSDPLKSVHIISRFPPRVGCTHAGNWEDATREEGAQERAPDACLSSLYLDLIVWGILSLTAIGELG